MKAIPLRERTGTVVRYALVDDEDFDRFGSMRWHFGERYVSHTVRYRRPDESVTYRPLRLHRLILGLEQGNPLEGEHIDGDRLNNVRANLRVATHRQNMQNVRSLPGSSSAYRGVSWNKKSRVWVASVRLDGKLHYLGSYQDEHEAGGVAAAWRSEHMPFSADARP